MDEIKQIKETLLVILKTLEKETPSNHGAILREEIKKYETKNEPTEEVTL